MSTDLLMNARQFFNAQRSANSSSSTSTSTSYPQQQQREQLVPGGESAQQLSAATGGVQSEHGEQNTAAEYSSGNIPNGTTLQDAQEDIKQDVHYYSEATMHILNTADTNTTV